MAEEKTTTRKRKTTTTKAKTTKKKATASKAKTTSSTEEMQISTEHLVEKVKELVREGNVRRIVVKKDDKILLNIPLTLAAVGIVAAPMLAALSTLAALFTSCTLEIEKDNS